MAKRTGAANREEAAGGEKPRRRRAQKGRRRSAAQARTASGAGEQRVSGRKRTTAASRRKSAGGARALLASARDMARSVGESGWERARGLAASAGSAAVDMGRGTQHVATEVADRVWENKWPALLIGAGTTWLAIDAARERFGDRSSGQRSRGSEKGIAERVTGFVRENPVLVGAATIGVGLAVGLAVPMTSGENEMLGDAKDAIVGRVKDAARGTMKNMRNVADLVR